MATILLDRAAEQQALTHSFGSWPTWSEHEGSLAMRENNHAPAIRQVGDYVGRSLHAPA